jgi:hypothetical protein
MDLMVHSLPSGESAGFAPPSVTGRWKMLAIVLVCSLPVIAAYFAYYVVRPLGRAGFGELIDPVRAMPQQQATSMQGGAVPLAALKGQWLLLAVAGGACPQECQRRLYLQRQLRGMLGKDQERVDAVWLVSDQAAVDPGLRAGLQDATVLRVDQAALDAWLVAAPGHALSDYLFVVDPLGNTMMRFPAVFDGPGAAKARRDLERLLRASASWDQPGR